MSLSYRLANKDDERLIFDWANDIDVREASFNTSPIKWENHINWFRKKISDNDTLFLIFLMETQPAGVVRIESTDKAVIGISIDRKYRGKKLATSMLKEACIAFWISSDVPIYAYIKKNNIASIKTFEKAGFNYVKDIKLSNFESIELICEKCL